MPEGSSSEAPVIRPGPRLLRKSLNTNGLACSTLASGLRSAAFLVCFEAVFFLFAMPDPSRLTNALVPQRVPGREPDTSVAARGRDRVHPVVAEHMRHEAHGLEYFGEGVVANVQSASVGAERRHHGAHPVAGETSPLHRASARGDARLWMQMSGDFAGRAGRLMAKHDSPYRDFARDHAADVARQRRIVIARDPDPVAARLQCGEGFAVPGRQPLMRLAIVKTVTERYHGARIVP